MPDLNPFAALNEVENFLQAGGNVLLVIMGATFIMWGMILERFIYFGVAHGGVAKKAQKVWAERADHSTFWALAVREKLISDVRQESERFIGMIRAFVGVAPLLGLLGTVTGMIEVFDVMAATGSSNARLMAGGISKATIPTMAGLVASLSGVILISVLDRRTKAAVAKISDDLVVEPH